MTTYTIVDPAGQASGFLSLNASIGSTWGLADIQAFSLSYSVYGLQYTSSTPGLALAIRGPGSTDVLTAQHPFQNGGEFSVWDTASDIEVHIGRDSFSIVWEFSDVVSPTDEADSMARTNSIAYEVVPLQTPSIDYLFGLSAILLVAFATLQRSPRQHNLPTH